MYGIASFGFTSTSRTFSEVVVETFEILDILVITPVKDSFFQKLQVLL